MSTMWLEKQLEVFPTGMKLVAEVVGTPTTFFSWEFQICVSVANLVGNVSNRSVSGRTSGWKYFQPFFNWSQKWLEIQLYYFDAKSNQIFGLEILVGNFRPF